MRHMNKDIPGNRVWNKKTQNNLFFINKRVNKQIIAHP